MDWSRSQTLVQAEVLAGDLEHESFLLHLGLLLTIHTSYTHVLFKIPSSLELENLLTQNTWFWPSGLRTNPFILHTPERE